MKSTKNKLVKNKIYLQFFSIFFIFCSPSLHASIDKNKEFDSIYFHTAVTVATKDIEVALHIADSLFLNSEGTLNKVKSLMLSSSLFQQKGDLASAIRIAEKAYSLAHRSKIYDWQARISGFLSTQYRLMEMYEEGERYLKEGIATSEKIANEQMKFLYKGLILQEKTFYFLSYDEPKEALVTAREAQIFFEKLERERDRNYFIASNQELLGRTSIKLEEWDLAESYLLNAIEALQKLPGDDFVLGGRIYSSLGRTYLQQEKLDSAFIYLTKVEELLAASTNLSLAIEVYKTLADYYHFTEDYSSYITYNERYLSSFKKSESEKKKSIHQFIELTKAQNLATKRNKNVFIRLSFLLFLGIIGTVIFFRRRQKKQKEMFQKVMDDVLNIKEESFVKLAQLTPENTNNRNQEGEDSKVMPKETEEAILEELISFEKGGKYLDKNISLSKLASIVDTNPKYLSHVLNTHKEQNFNTYINTLRIKYIVSKLKNNKQYRSYKISYLAEETGFSSHTKFSQAFKAVTNLSPSVFLKELEKVSI